MEKGQILKTTIFLSRRNLETLLSKLNRRAVGEETRCTLIKYKNPNDPPEYAQKLDEIKVVAVEDADYYRTRPAGAVLPEDEPPLRNETGTAISYPDPQEWTNEQTENLKLVLGEVFGWKR